MKIIQWVLSILEKSPRDRHASAGIRTPASRTAGEHSSKEISRQLINNYSEHLHVASTPSYFNF